MMTQHPQTRRTTGFSLLEMVLSLSVLGIVFTAVGSVVVLASKVLPQPGSAFAAGLEQSKAIGQLAEDLQVARFVTEHSANDVTLIVDDRTGDGRPDRLRYTWSGTAGDPLTLSINGSTPATIVDNLQVFALSFTTEDRVDTVAGGGEATSGESLLYTYDTATSWEVRDLADEDNRVGIGQFVLPDLPAGVAGYAVTRVRVSARSRGPANGETYVRLYDTDGTLPTGAALAEEVLLESSLIAAFTWIDITFATPVDRLAGESFAVALEWKTDRHSAGIEFDDAGSGGGLLTQNKDTDPWVNTGGKNLLLEVYGTCSLASPDISLTRQVRTCAKVTLQVGDAAAQQINCAMYREPGVHSGVWDAGFDVSPEGIDFDGDGSDWVKRGTGGTGTFANGRWEVDGYYTLEPTQTFLDPILVDVVLGATAADRGGAKFQINADQTGGLAMPIAVRSGRDASGSHYVRLMTRPINEIKLEATDLGPNLPRVRLLIVPAENAVAMIVNGEPIGTYTYEPVTNTSLRGTASIAEYSDGVFDDVSIRVGGTAVVTQQAAGGGSGSGSGTGSGTGGTGASAALSTPGGTTESSTSSGGWGSWW